jgi:hypothetical protein
MALISETRDVTGFNEVQVSGWGEARIEQGETENLVIEADEAIMPKLSSEVLDGRLVLSFRMEWWEWISFWLSWLFMPDKDVVYHITLAEFKGAQVSGAGAIKAGALRGTDCRFGISGSGKIEVDALECDSVELRISGSGGVMLAGTAASQNIQISGSGSLKNADLATERTAIGISGSGSAAVNASQALDVDISGSGSVRYRGQPHITKHISGTGSIKGIA